MSGHVWQSGDIALVTLYRPHRIALVRPRQQAGGLLEFAYITGGWDVAGDPDVTARPLVVIDPEDRAQIERLADVFCEYPSVGWVDQMQAALRTLAAPKPPRRGLGGRVMRRPAHHWSPQVSELISGRPDLAEIGLAPLVAMLGSAA